jgi:hypothetical protein
MMQTIRQLWKRFFEWFIPLMPDDYDMPPGHKKGFSSDTTKSTHHRVPVVFRSDRYAGGRDHLTKAPPMEKRTAKSESLFGACVENPSERRLFIMMLSSNSYLEAMERVVNKMLALSVPPQDIGSVCLKNIGPLNTLDVGKETAEWARLCQQATKTTNLHKFSLN